jgi:hypothetical protein
MQVDVFSLIRGSAQGAAPAGPPENLVTIVGTYPGELEEPRNLIHNATRAIKGSHKGRRSKTNAAKKALGLILAFCERVTATGRWSSTPLNDLIELRAAANAMQVALIPAPPHVIQLCQCADAMVQAWREAAAVQGTFAS